MNHRSATSIGGAQASISKRANEAVDRALPLLDGLTPLTEDAGDGVEAIKTIVRKQMLALVEDLGAPGLQPDGTYAEEAPLPDGVSEFQA